VNLRTHPEKVLLNLRNLPENVRAASEKVGTHRATFIKVGAPIRNLPENVSHPSRNLPENVLHPSRNL
jgi:hypothetical protein